MKPLPVNIIVNEKKKLGNIKLAKDLEPLALYEGPGERSNLYVLTDTSDPKKVYMIVDQDLWNSMFEQRGVRFNINNW